MDKPSGRAVGNYGEELACAYLVAQGYTVVCRNYTTRHGELDVIVTKENIIAFVEVKTRTASAHLKRYGRPAKAVDAKKWEHIFFAAKAYLKQEQRTEKPRLDVIEVYLHSDGKQVIDIRHYPSAYSV